jgi:hypothetical protein
MLAETNWRDGSVQTRHHGLQINDIDLSLIC